MRKAYVHLLRYLALLVVVFFLSGCASRMNLPARKAEVENSLPTTWQCPLSEIAVAHDITSLIDNPKVTALIEEALAANPDLTATAYRLKASGLLLSITSSELLPKVMFDGNGTRTGSSEKETSSFTSNLNVSWEIDLWQRLADQHDAAVYGVKAQREDYIAARNALAARVVQAWIGLITNERAVVIEKKRIQALVDTENVILDRYNTGLGDLTDLDTARTKSEAAREILVKRELDLSKARRSLELLLGRYPSGVITAEDALPQVKNPVVGVPAKVLASRPDIQAAWKRVKKSDLDVAVANKAMLPSLTLKASIAHTAGTISNLAGSAGVWTLAGAISQPIFMGGKLKDTAAARSEESKAAWEEYRKIVLNAMNEVENGLVMEQGIERRKEYLKKSLYHATQSRLGYEQRYSEGLSDIINLLTAEETELNTEIQLLEVSALQLDNRVKLALAAGLNAGLNSPNNDVLMENES